MIVDLVLFYRPDFHDHVSLSVDTMEKVP